MGRAITVAIIAAALALAAPFAAHAAGLGKLNVLSPLGQPLNAEIEIVALRPGEEEGLTARVAGPEAFSAAGIEPAAVLNTVRFAIERRGSQRILRVTTQQPVNDPFVELLVELQWATGRLVREYTFLLDPPEYKSRALALAQKPKPVPAEPKPAPVEAKPAEEAKPVPPIEPKPIEPAAPPPVIAATPAPTPAPATEAEKPAPAAETPAPAAEPAKEPAKEEPAKEPAKAEETAKPELVQEPGIEKAYEVMKGDTLGKIARDNLPPGISLNQMLIAIYRANQDAFIRENLNLVRAGRILNIPTAEAIGTVDADEANRLVRAHMAEFREYRSRLAAVPATADTSPGQREAAGPIETKPEAPKPAAQDQVRLSKVDPQKPSASGAAAARGDDAVARERALKEAQSRVSDLEKNVADLQKLLELKNQQLAEMEKKAAAAKPAPAAPAPAPAAKAPEAPKPMAEAPKPAPTPAPAPGAPEAPKPAAPAAKPAPKPAPPPPPEPSLFDEFLDNPVALAGLGGVALLLLVYALWAWRKKKAAQTRFQDSVIGAAAAGAAAGASMTEPTLGSSTPAASQPTASTPPAAVAAEEVDPIAEADVYMAYGRDAQAEEILKEALQKDSNRVAVHAKLLEIYAKRQDPKAFEQSAVKLKSLTNSAGPEWEKAAALGKSIDPSNGLYAGAAAAAATASIPSVSGSSAPAPTLDFDIGGAGQGSASAPDLTLETRRPDDTGLDFDVSASTQKLDVSGTTQKLNVSTEETVVAPSAKAADTGLDFNLDLGTDAPAAPAAPEKKPEPAAEDPGLTFDLNLDLGGDKKSDSASSAAPDLSTISLDLGSADSGAASAPAGTDPKWQEIATKLDLAKAYEEMGDKDGARELLNEVVKDGDAAQKGQAQQLLAKLG
ncbi:MAG TPA: FimV/HubP family polar landmark protein [Burkholderiales bacterium]|nr:FimV/HubP family polar landmark protein [Burkholderiales bacterium]